MLMHTDSKVKICELHNNKCNIEKLIKNNIIFIGYRLIIKCDYIIVTPIMRYLCLHKYSIPTVFTLVSWILLIQVFSRGVWIQEHFPPKKYVVVL